MCECKRAIGCESVNVSVFRFGGKVLSCVCVLLYVCHIIIMPLDFPLIREKESMISWESGYDPVL